MKDTEVPAPVRRMSLSPARDVAFTRRSFVEDGGDCGLTSASPAASDPLRQFGGGGEDEARRQRTPETRSVTVRPLRWPGFSRGPTCRQ